MSLRNAAALLLFATWGLVQYVLISSSPVLTRSAFASLGMPAGTLIAWVGLVALPAAALLARLQCLGRVGIRALLFALILAVAWGFVCFGLADNWSFNFSAAADGFRGSEAAGRLFWWYSLTAWALPLVVLWGAAAYRLFSRSRR